VKQALIYGCLAVAVAACWLGVFGLLRLRNAYDRLHMTGYVAIAGGLFFSLALAVAQPGTAPKVALIFIAMVFTGTLLTHAIGRAMRIRDQSEDRP
jgi:monovalent cation/proton antiporter MnhG/PhaG subunit